MSLPEHTPPKIHERELAEMRARLGEFGLVVTIRCQYCRAPLWDTESVTAHAGPVCRRRHEESDPGATPAKKSRTEAARNIPTR